MESPTVWTSEESRPCEPPPTAGENKGGNSRFIKTIHHWPTRILCIATVALQAASLDFYLISHLGNLWFTVIIGDVIVCVVFIIAMVMAQRNIVREKRKGRNLTFKDSRAQPLSYVGWLCYASLLNLKIIVTYKEYAHELKQHAFFGVNTLSTTIALDGIVFVTFLASQHNAITGTPRRAFVEDLTSSVLFDVLDGVESLDILLDREARKFLYPGLENTIIAICCLTFLLPTVPMVTLSVTRFGLKDVGETPILFHKLAVGYMINLPLFVVRMILWHGMEEGVSVFALKNIIMMGVATSEVLETILCKKAQLARRLTAKSKECNTRL